MNNFEVVGTKCDRLRECNGVMMDLIEMGDNSWAYLWPYWAILGCPSLENVAACVLGPNNNKAIIRFYPYDDHQDRGACQIWKVILESRHCVYLTTLQLLIFTLAQTISNSNSNIHEQLSTIKRIKMDWTLKPFFNYLIFFIKWKAWNTRKKYSGESFVQY